MGNWTSILCTRKLANSSALSRLAGSGGGLVTGGSCEPDGGESVNVVQRVECDDQGVGSEK